MPIERPRVIAHPAHIGSLQGKLKQIRQENLENLVRASDWDDFNFQIGRIAALDEAMAVCEQVESEMNR